MGYTFIWLLVFLYLGTISGYAQPSTTVEATIDASEAYEPVSEYIYGQFLELIGDSIYAEMLDSRKLCHPILKIMPETENNGYHNLQTTQCVFV